MRTTGLPCLQSAAPASGPKINPHVQRCLFPARKSSALLFCYAWCSILLLGARATTTTTADDLGAPVDSDTAQVDTFWDWFTGLGPLLIACAVLMCVVILLMCGLAFSSYYIHAPPPAARQPNATYATQPKVADECCINRLPNIGETVYTMEGAQTADDENGNPSAWHLKAGEPSRVVEVDPDGDFKLRNPKGVISGWQFRKNFKYPHAEDCEVILPVKDELQKHPTASSNYRTMSSKNRDGTKGGKAKMPRALVDKPSKAVPRQEALMAGESSNALTGFSVGTQSATVFSVGTQSATVFSEGTQSAAVFSVGTQSATVFSEGTRSFSVGTPNSNIKTVFSVETQSATSRNRHVVGEGSINPMIGSMIAMEQRTTSRNRHPIMTVDLDSLPADRSLDHFDRNVSSYEITQFGRPKYARKNARYFDDDCRDD